MSLGSKIVALRMLGVVPVAERHDGANGTYHKGTEHVVGARRGIPPGAREDPKMKVPYFLAKKKCALDVRPTETAYPFLLASTFVTYRPGKRTIF